MPYDQIQTWDRSVWIPSSHVSWLRSFRTSSNGWDLFKLALGNILFVRMTTSIILYVYWEKLHDYPSVYFDRTETWHSVLDFTKTIMIRFILMTDLPIYAFIISLTVQGCEISARTFEWHRHAFWKVYFDYVRGCPYCKAHLKQISTRSVQNEEAIDGTENDTVELVSHVCCAVESALHTIPGLLPKVQEKGDQDEKTQGSFDWRSLRCLHLMTTAPRCYFCCPHRQQSHRG